MGGCTPDTWGSTVWDTIHLICWTAPESLDPGAQMHYTAFFKSLPYVLPCASCSEHAVSHLEAVPIENAVGSRDALFEWSVQYHNAVNKMLGKPEMSLEVARARWEKRMGAGRKNEPGSKSTGAGVAEGWFMKIAGSPWIYILLSLMVVIGAIGMAWSSIHLRMKQRK